MWEVAHLGGQVLLSEDKTCSHADVMYQVLMIRRTCGGSLVERLSRTGKVDTKELDASLTRKDGSKMELILDCIHSIWNDQQCFTVHG